MTDRFKKQPTEVYDYEVDAEDYFEDLEGDTVASVVITVDNVTVPALEIGPGAHAEYDLVSPENVKFRVWVGGGLHLEKYKVTCVITTTDGRVAEHEFIVKVKET